METKEITMGSEYICSVSEMTIHDDGANAVAGV